MIGSTSSIHLSRIFKPSNTEEEIPGTLNLVVGLPHDYDRPSSGAQIISLFDYYRASHLLKPTMALIQTRHARG